MKNISKAFKFIGVEILVSLPIFIALFITTYSQVQAGSLAEALISISAFLVVTAICITIFNKGFTQEETLRFPLQVGILYLIWGILFGYQNMIYGIISFIVLYIFLKIKFRKTSVVQNTRNAS